jgi:hypothetical protein
MIERGLYRDDNDQKSLRHGRERDIGFTFEKEFYQPMPMFFTSEGNNFPGMIGNQRGAHAFLICGGPSFGELDHSKLDNCWTMALNNSVKTYRPDAWCCVDDPARFIKSIWLDPKIQKFVPFDHTEKKLWDNSSDPDKWGPLLKENGEEMKVRECPNMVFYRRNEKFEAKRFLWEYTFNWGNSKKHGGSRTCMLAALKILFVLGFREVYLLGCDLNMDEQHKYHFNEERDRGAQKGNMSTYQKMINVYFPQLKPQFDKVGFHVYNCNPESRLKVFPNLPFDEAVKRSNGNMEVDTELSYGMYKTFDVKKSELDKTRKEIRNGTYKK